MYNLFVVYQEGTWDSNAWQVPSGRVLNLTDEDIRDRYSSLGPDATAEICTFPCLFVYEEGQDNTVRIGWLTQVKRRGSDSARVTYEMDPDLPALSRDAIKGLSAELDIRRLELGTTHWAIKDVELFPELLKAGLLTEDDIDALPADSLVHRYGFSRPVTKIQVRPEVFRVPTTGTEPDLASVMMPFDSKFNAVYDALKGASENAGLRCQRADDIWDEPEVIQDVFSLIYRSRVVICDFSERNTNVFYEAGIAHTLGKTVIPICQNKEDIPFDLRHIRFVPYLNNEEGRSALKNSVSAKLKALARK